jgi:branched-chain amino acid transport system substrate-binding protein
LASRRADGARRARRAAVHTAAIGIAALGLAACATRPHYGVATTIVTPKGNCDGSRVVPIGVAIDLSGSEAGLGQEFLAGLRIAVAQVNRSHGVMRSHACLELLYKDTKGDGHVSKRAIDDLVNEEGVAYLVAPLASPEIQFSGPDLAKDGIPTASFSSFDQTYQPHHYPQLFPLAASTTTVATAMVSFAHSRGWGRVAIVATDDPAAREGAAEVTDAARRAGLAVTGSVTASRGTDTTATLEQLRLAGPDAVALVGDSPDVAAVLSARAKLGWHVPVVAEAIAADRSVVVPVGLAGLDNVFAVVPRAIVVGRQAPLDPALDSLREQVRTLLHAPRLDGSLGPYAQAADAISMFASVANSINSTAPGPIRTYLENANFQGVLASYSFTTDAHDGIGADQVTVAPVSSLSDGVFGSP